MGWRSRQKLTKSEKRDRFDKAKTRAEEEEILLTIEETLNEKRPEKGRRGRERDC